MLTADRLDDRAPMESMGPTMLSQMMFKEKRDSAIEPDWPTIYQHCEASVTSAYFWRYSWWTHWQRLAEYWKPRRYRWLVTPNQMNRGSPINDSIIDGTSVFALNTCAAGMWSGFTNPDTPWVGLAPKDENFQVDAAGRKWLDDVQDLILDVLADSNFYDSMAQAFEDLALFGSSPVYVYEDFYDKIRLYVPCAGEYFNRCGARQSIDSNMREFQATVSQIVEMFDFANCPSEIQRLWLNGGAARDREYVVRSLCEPNYEIEPPGGGKKFRPVPGGFPYREIYWLRGIQGDRPLSMRGYHWRPFECLIWARTGNDPYGRSPCMEALGDNKEVQWSQVRKAEYIEKLIRPPMGADVELKMEPNSILPGKTTFMTTAGGTTKKFWPLFEVSPAALPPLVQSIEQANLRIERFLFVDVFMAITQMQGVQPRNELELTKRDLERLQKLGPVINLTMKSLADIILRILDILKRRGQLPPKPDSLKTVPLKLKFENMMRKAQRAAAAVGMKGTIASLGQMEEIAKVGQVPGPLRKFNLTKMAEKIAIDDGVPADCIFSDAEVAKHDAARQKAVAAAQMPGLATAAAGAAKDLGGAQLGGGTALGAMLGGGAPQGA